MRHGWTCLLVVAFIVLLCSCSIPKRLESVPEKDRTKAVIPGMPGVRYWVDTDIEPMKQGAIAAIK